MNSNDGYAPQRSKGHRPEHRYQATQTTILRLFHAMGLGDYTCTEADLRRGLSTRWMFLNVSVNLQLVVKMIEIRVIDTWCIFATE